ncbi:hypothetical protein ACFVZH_39685 [Streptomyces sp. NPDC059534]|uniref:hypothetical protein n=1 Tax=Streptomyces sp. NPDC059534 TaxID=3346859 RepID=UPI0036B54B30
MYADEWAGLSANLKFQDGFATWDVWQLVKLIGAKKAGARIIESIEQKLAENNIGHLPTKLPTDSTRRVLLYAKDHADTGFIVRLIHELALQEPDDGDNRSVHQLEILLNTISTKSTGSYRVRSVNPQTTPEELRAREALQQVRRTAEFAYIRSYFGLENRQDIRVDIGVRVRLRGHEGEVVDTAGTEFLMVLVDGADRPIPYRVSPDLEYATNHGWVTVPSPPSQASPRAADDEGF